MKFDHPYILWFLIVLVPVAFVGIANCRGATRSFARVWPRGPGSRRVRVFGTIQVIRLLSICVFIAACIFAFARPRSGFESVSRDVTGADFALCLDVSRSMLARDGNPESTQTRLDAARGFLRKFLGTLESGRVSLIITKGVSETLVPMTDDVDYVLRVLDSLGPDSITSAGTDLVSGLNAANLSFPVSEPRTRFILLLSDGESSSDFTEAAVSSFGSRIIAVALGSEKGAYINKGSKNEHFTKTNRGALIELAEATDGMVISSRDAEIVSELNRGSFSDSGNNPRSLVREPRYITFGFILVSVVSLLAIAVCSLLPFGFVSGEGGHA